MEFIENYQSNIKGGFFNLIKRLLEDFQVNKLDKEKINYENYDLKRKLD